MWSVRLRPLLGSIALLGLLTCTVGACTDEQKRDIEGAAIRAVIQDETEDELDDADIDVDDLRCEADITQDSIVTGSCTGTTTDGAAIETTLAGRVDVDEAECDSQIAITIDGQILAEDTDFDCLDS